MVVIRENTIFLLWFIGFQLYGGHGGVSATMVRVVDVSLVFLNPNFVQWVVDRH